MKQIVLFIIVWLMGAVSIGAIAAQEVEQRAQLSGKLIGVSVIAECPSPSVLRAIRREGRQMRADYTAFPEVGGASQCPATDHGPMWPYSQLQIEADEVGQWQGNWQVRGGVTVGLHYKIMR